MRNTEIPTGVMKRGLRLLLGLAGALLLAKPAASGQHLFEIALDTDVRDADQKADLWSGGKSSARHGRTVGT